jgi:hypothetical protein
MFPSARIIMVMSLLPASVVAAPSVAMGSSLSYVPENGVCEEEELCLFRLDNFRGDVYDFAPCENVASYFGLRFINSDRRLNNNAESVWNRSGYVYEIYDHSNFGGQSMEIFGGERIDEDDLGALADDISSHQCIGS